MKIEVTAISACCHQARMPASYVVEAAKAAGHEARLVASYSSVRGPHASLEGSGIDGSTVRANPLIKIQVEGRKPVWLPSRKSPWKSDWKACFDAPELEA